MGNCSTCLDDDFDTEFTEPLIYDSSEQKTPPNTRITYLTRRALKKK